MRSGSRMASKVFVCEADLEDGGMRGVNVEGRWLLISRHRGEYSALDAACAHSGAPLFEGSLDPSGAVTCPLHYARFDCRTGEILSRPPICGDQTVFRIKVSNGKIFWLKDPAGEAEGFRAGIS